MATPDLQATTEMSVAVLKAAIEIEEFGIKFYSDLSGCVGDERGAALFRSLAADEREHRRILRKELDRLGQMCDVSCIAPMHEYLELIPQRVFTPPPGACLTLKDEISALEMGIEVEENSRRMYSDSLSKVDDKMTRSTLESLVVWETKHKQILEENLQNLKLEGTWYGYSPILEG
ncbi:MAG: ferritin family protein [Methanomassiliicoccales archaeon]|jgi:rubrerythrin